MVTEPGPSCILVKHLSHAQGAIKRGTGMQVAPMSFVAWGHQAQIILQPILGAWGPGLPWCDHHHLWQGAPGSHHYIRAAHLLPPGHWGHYLVLIEFWGLTSPSHFPVVGVENSLTNFTELHHLLVSLGVSLLPAPSLCYLPHPLSGERPPNQSGSFCFLHSPHLPGPRLAGYPPPSLPNHTILHTLSLLASHIYPWVWDT